MIRNFTVIPIVLLINLLCLAGQLCAESAFLTHILDGDSFRVRLGQHIVTIRLYGVDCPEYGQDGWSEAKRYSKKMLGTKRLTLQPMDIDRYGRTVALVYVGGRLLNSELIRQGWAWHYQKYCRVQPLCREFKQLEQKARSKKIGIWQKKSPTPPWVWKRRKK